MARKPETPPSYYELIEDDAAVPEEDMMIGPPVEPVEPEPFADFLRPEDFDDDVRAMVEALKG